MNCYDLLKRIMDASRMKADAKRTALKALVSEVMWHFPDGKALSLIHISEPTRH